MTTKHQTGPILVAVCVIAFAGIVAYETAAIPVAPLYSKIGPTVFPQIVAAGLGLLGLALLWQAVRGTWTAGEDAAVPVDWRALGWLGTGLILNVLLIKWLGFILASTILFTCVARAFGSTRPLRDVAVALPLAASAYFGFSKLLGISIGAGILERLF